jgi:hypothetical protein
MCCFLCCFTEAGSSGSVCSLQIKSPRESCGWKNVFSEILKNCKNKPVKELQKSK